MDAVALLDGTETVRNRDRCTALGCAIQCVLNNSFTIAVEGRCGLIKEKNGRVTEQSTGDGDALFLSTAELTTLATDFRVKATVMTVRVEQRSKDEGTYLGKELMNSRIFASRQAASSSSCVTSS